MYYLKAGERLKLVSLTTTSRKFKVYTEKKLTGGSGTKTKNGQDTDLSPKKRKMKPKSKK